ncbi:uncharacterized protein BYT42DRAFT_564288 [Radiomyces spectabilis]|uniref:uncharacterized protein n=1 Tax=Radiomyces spectabilis TaxID=64574 RepID=UPI00221F9D46|nr:uncharacterized protein BYT42DRAFT_564288 [Radiomyces spectabilis]KAI8384983.1 hypothetical protein BYT42DRAFT_564288 [Radiomyces spectabilis]
MGAERVITMPSRKNNTIYENWKVYSKHGKLMFRCNAKKAQWYLKRQLAVTKEDNHSIQLTFEAKGNGHRENDYLIEDRKNVCVACGSDQQLTLHHVVPEMYRRWMPLVIKSKSSRDILPLCKICHNLYEDEAMKLKKHYVKHYEIPLEGKGWISKPKNRYARKAATALLRCSDKIPADRQQVLKQAVIDFSAEQEDWRDLSFEEKLERCSELTDLFQGPDFVEHGEYVIGQLMLQKVIIDSKERWPDLERFIKEWRQHFLDHLKPKHLSPRWTVDSDIYTN